MNKLLQVYGKNTDAQEIVQTELTSAFPTLVDQFNMVERIYEKFYDWMFPFVYTEDGGASMTWRANVRSWIAKNPKLAELETHFAQGTLSGTFTENIDDTDDTTFTDNRATKQKTTFKGIDATRSAALADEVANEFEQGKNTTENARAYSRTRTYADGRNWVQVMQDVQKAEEPVYTFINSFARLLVSPTWCKQDFCEVLPPSVEMSVEAESLPAGSTATAEIVNRGTPFNADWLLSLSLVAGETGPIGEAGKDALIYTSVFETSNSPSVGIVINLSITPFSHTPVDNEYFLMCWQVPYSTYKRSYICIAVVESVSSELVSVRILSVLYTTGQQGATGPQGPQGPQGPAGPAGVTKYCHNVNILTMKDTAISITLVNERRTPYNNIAELQLAIFEAVGSIRAQTRFIPANGWLDNTWEVRGLYIQQIAGSDKIMCLTGYSSGLELGSVHSMIDTVT